MEYIFEKAKPSDIEDIWNIISGRIDWMNEVGIRQWNVTDYYGRYPREYYLDHIESGRMFLLRKDGEAVAVAALLEEDERWDGFEELDAFYVHHLASKVGEHGAGTEMLKKILDHSVSCGKKALRLDCATDNDFLNEYYKNFGFSYCGKCRDRLYYGNLMEIIL